MLDEESLPVNSSKINKSTIKILFSQKTSEYNLFFSHQCNSIHSIFLQKDLISNDALMYIKKRFESIKFVNLGSLIDFCKTEKISNLQIVFEWINFFIYKEEKKLFDNYKSPESNLITGVCNLIERLKSEKEEIATANGFKYYVSDIRNLVIKLLLMIINSTEVLGYGTEFDAFISKFTLCIFNLNFDEASKIIKEAFSSKERKIPNEVMTYFMIFQEVIIHLNHSSNSTYNSLNDSVKNIMSTFDKIDLPSNLPYLISFVQQKFCPKLNEFLINKDISILIKLVYIFKHADKENLILCLQALENFYVENGYLEGLIITGNSKKSIQMLQKYLDYSDDLLVAVILSKFFVNSKENFHSKCENELYDSLNRMKMFNERIHLSQKLNEIVLHMEKGFKHPQAGEKKSSIIGTSTFNSAEFILNCFYCNAKISPDRADQFRNLFMNNKEGNEFIDFCPKCIKKLPNCAICLCPIEVNIPVHRSRAIPSYHNSDIIKREKNDEDLKGPDMKYLWCTKCRHGGHLEHIKDWFLDLMICPVADCSCICLEYNHIMI